MPSVSVLNSPYLTVSSFSFIFAPFSFIFAFSFSLACCSLISSVHSHAFSCIFLLFGSKSLLCVRFILACSPKFHFNTQRHGAFLLSSVMSSARSDFGSERITFESCDYAGSSCDRSRGEGLWASGDLDVFRGAIWRCAPVDFSGGIKSAGKRDRERNLSWKDSRDKEGCEGGRNGDIWTRGVRFRKRCEGLDRQAKLFFFKFGKTG